MCGKIHLDPKQLYGNDIYIYIWLYIGQPHVPNFSLWLFVLSHAYLEQMGHNGWAAQHQGQNPFLHSWKMSNQADPSRESTNLPNGMVSNLGVKARYSASWHILSLICRYVYIIYIYIFTVTYIHTHCITPLLLLFGCLTLHLELLDFICDNRSETVGNNSSSKEPG